MDARQTPAFGSHRKSPHQTSSRAHCLVSRHVFPCKIFTSALVFSSVPCASHAHTRTRAERARAHALSHALTHARACSARVTCAVGVDATESAPCPPHTYTHPTYVHTLVCPPPRAIESSRGRARRTRATREGHASARTCVWRDPLAVGLGPLGRLDRAVGSSVRVSVREIERECVSVRGCVCADARAPACAPACARSCVCSQRANAGP